MPPKKSHDSNLIYRNKEEISEKVGDKPSTILEKEVTHTENRLFLKFFETKGGKKSKIIVIAPGTGGEYKLVIDKDGDKKESTHTKSEILAFLKKNSNLAFMVEYINKTKSIARPKKRAKTKSKSKTKSKAKSKSGSKSRRKSR